MKISHLNGQTCSFEKNESLPMEDETFTNFSRRNSFERKTKKKKKNIHDAQVCRASTSPYFSRRNNSINIVSGARASIEPSRIKVLKVVHQIDVVENNRFEGEQPPEKIEFLYKKKGNAIENTTHTDIFQLLFFFFFCKFYSPELQLFVRRFAPWRIQKCLLTHSLLFINPFTIRMFHGLCKNELRIILRLLLVRIYFFLIFDNWEKMRKLRIL